MKPDWMKPSKIQWHKTNDTEIFPEPWREVLLTVDSMSDKSGPRLAIGHHNGKRWCINGNSRGLYILRWAYVDPYERKSNEFETKTL